MHSHGGPGAFHAVQTVVFRRTGHHINSVQLVFEAIHDLGTEYMRAMLIKHDPRGIFCCHGVYPRKRFRVADNALLYYRAPHYRDSSHDGHTRVLLAFYTPSVASKSLLISLLFLERPFLFFRHFPCGDHLCFTSFLSRSMNLRVGIMSTVLRLSYIQ